MRKLLFVDDHPVVLAGCRLLFPDSAGYNVWEARTAEEALTIFKREAPDAVIVDLNLEKTSGFDLIHSLLQLRRDANIVVFTMNGSPHAAKQAIEAGARGFVTKLEDSNQIVAAILEVMNGGRWISEMLLQDVASMGALGTRTSFALNNREAAVLRLLVRGRSLAEVADELAISYKSATSHCSLLRIKLNARTNSELVRIALEAGLV